MKKLLVLGTGCAKCQKLTELTKTAADQLGLDYEIEKVGDIKEIMKYGILMTPGLVVDGVVKVSGKVPSLDDIKKMIA